MTLTSHAKSETLVQIQAGMLAYLWASSKPRCQCLRFLPPNLFITLMSNIGVTSC